MPTMTPPRRLTVDIDAWRENRVPPDAERIVRFISSHKRCTWGEIADHMGWSDLPRPEWRAKMKRFRRWGVVWTLNKPQSTRIHPEVRPFL